MLRDVLEELVTKFVYDVDQLGLQKYTKAQEKINKNTQKMIGLNSTLAKGLRRLFVGAGAVIGIQGLVNTYRDLDLVRRSIEGLTKSTQDWDYIQKEALRTGTGIESVAKGYRNFYSAASMAGFDKSGIQDMYSDVLTASRAIGATQQQVGGALLALEQMLSKGRVSMEELRRQLGNALPGAFEIGAKAMGVTTEKFNEMVKKGISAAEFVPKFTKELLNTYKEAFPEAIKSLDFALVNLSTSWKLFQYEIMNGSAGQGLAETINSITAFFRSPEAITIAKGVGQALNLVARAMGVIVKHFRILLFLLGINMLSQAPSLFSKLTRMLLRFNKEVLVTGSFVGGLNKLLPTTIVLLKAIGKTGLLIGKNFLWITVIMTALYGIYLIIQDIWTYFAHPEWESFTKDLVEKSPEFAKAMERFRDGIKAVSDIWQNSLYPAVKNLIDAVAIWAGGDHSTLGAIFEWILKQIGKVLGALGDVLMAIQRIDEANPFSDRNKKIEEARNRVSKGTGWDNFVLRPSVLAKGKGTQQLKQLFSVIPNSAPFAPSPNLYGGYNLQKSETYAPNVSVTQYITPSNNSSSVEIANEVNKQLSSVVDRANMSIMQDKPKLYSTMADKPR